MGKAEAGPDEEQDSRVVADDRAVECAGDHSAHRFDEKETP
jgi:hypothetical protein